MSADRLTIRQFWSLIKVTAQEWWEDNTFRLAASLAFYTIFSMAPILVIATSVAGFLVGRERAVEGVVGEIRNLAGDDAARAVQEISLGAQHAGGNVVGVIVGIATIIFGSTVVFAELQSAINQIWDVKADPEKRFFTQFLKDRLRSFAIVLAVGFLLLVSLLLSATVSWAVRESLAWVGQIQWLLYVANMLASFVVVWLLFMLIYRYLPDVRITWTDVATGAAVTSLLFTVGKELIGLYLGQMAPGSAYGAAGSFAVLLIWVYYSALISFFGAEFTQVYARRFGSRIQPEAHAVRVGEKSDQV